MRNSQPWKEPDEIPHESSLEQAPTTSTPKRQSSTRNQKFLTVVPLVNLPKSCSRVQVSDSQLPAEKNHEMSYSLQRSSSLAEGQRAQEAEVLWVGWPGLRRAPSHLATRARG